MSITPQRTLAACLIAVALGAPPAAVAEIGHSLRSNKGERADDNHFELGLGLLAYDSPRLRGLERGDTWLLPIFNGRYQWKRLFVENFAEDSNGLALGYSAHRGDNWSLDLLLTRQHGGLSIETDDAGAIATDGDEVFAVRIGGYAGKLLWQGQLWHDVGGTHKGGGAQLLVGSGWQLRNFNLHAMAGANYRSAAVLDYYYGVSAPQAQVTGLSEFSAGAGFGVAAEVGVTRALSKHWVFRSTARYAQLPDAIADSPRLLQAQQHSASLLTSLTYVF